MLVGTSKARWMLLICFVVAALWLLQSVDTDRPSRPLSGASLTQVHGDAQNPGGDSTGTQTSCDTVKCTIGQVCQDSDQGPFCIAVHKWEKSDETNSKPLKNEGVRNEVEKDQIIMEGIEVVNVNQGVIHLSQDPKETWNGRVPNPHRVMLKKRRSPDDYRPQKVYAPPCTNIHDGCRPEWKPCCPGQFGNFSNSQGIAHCSRIDCDPDRKKGGPCLGIWMSMNCMQTCGFCQGNQLKLENFVDSNDTLRKKLEARHQFEPLCNILEKRLVNVLPKLLLNGTSTVVMVTVSSGYVDFFKNWRYSAERVGINKYLVIAEDESVYNELSKDNLPALVMSPTPVEDSEQAQGLRYKSATYNALVGNRPRYIRVLLELGIDVLYGDIDAVWNDNPLPDLVGNYDIWIQADADSPSDYPFHMLCTGFMFIKSKPQTQQLIFDWEYELSIQEKKTVNQEIFNKLARRAMHRSSIKIKPLDYARFPSGALMYFYPNWMRQQKVVPAVIHNNFMVGAKKKRDKFITIGKWFVQ